MPAMFYIRRARRSELEQNSASPYFLQPDFCTALLNFIRHKWCRCGF
jgi:hypothetical protein